MFFPEEKLKRNLPNMLSSFRLISSPVVGYLLYKGNHCWAFVLYTFAAITDFLDGYTARKFSAEGEFGKILDPVADKFLILIPLGIFYLTDTTGDLYRPPLSLLIVLLLKEFLIVLGSLYFIAGEGKIPGPNLLGKFAVANLLLYTGIILLLLCLGSAKFFKPFLDLWGNAIAFVLIGALILYTVQFLKIRKEPWERG